MYLPNKYTYVEIPRETIDGVRRYATPDGERLPSVTTILEATKPAEKKKTLFEWRKRMGERRATEITTEAAARGTRMHKFLETWVKNGTTGEVGSNPYSIQSHDMAKIIIANGLVKCTEFWGTEVPVYFPRLYAGTTDLVGVHDGSPAILDFKQTNKPKKREWIDDYFLQLAAYATAHNEVHGTTINKGVIFMCSAAGEYQEFDISGTDFQYWVNAWFHRVELYYRQFV